MEIKARPAWLISAGDETKRLARHALLALGLFHIGILKRFCRRLPAPAVLALGRSVGRLAGLICTRERKVILAQLRFVRARLAAERRDCGSSLEQQSDAQILSRVFSHLGESVAELFLLDRLFQDVPEAVSEQKQILLHSLKHFEFDGDDRVLKTVKDREGSIALCAHLGNFELLAAYYAMMGTPLAVIARLPNDKKGARLISKLRQGYGAETIWRDQPDSARRLLAALRDKMIVPALVDQDTALENSFSPLFGVPAAVPSAIIKLALRLKISVFTAFIVRTGPMQHKIICRAVDYDTDGADVMETILRVYHQRFEELLLQYPEQWIWWHRRWRRRPEIDYDEDPAQLRSTSSYLSWLEEQTRGS